MVGWHHRLDGLDGHEFEQTPGDSEGQGSLAYCSPWDCKEFDTTKQLNSNSNTIYISYMELSQLWFITVKMIMALCI